MITIKEIADKVGVSPTTVSNVLHGRTGRVSEKTRAQIEAALEENGYVSNMAARIVANRGSKLIALVIGYQRTRNESLIADPFVGAVTGAVERAVRERGYYLMLYNNPDMKECLRFALSWSVEGIILLGVQREDYFKLRERLDVPIVTIDTCFQKTDKDFVNIGLQDRRGVKLAVEHLIQKGHRRIGFARIYRESTFERRSEVDLLREKSFVEAMKANGLPVAEEQLLHLPVEEKERQTWFRAFADRNFDGMTALVFVADVLALEALWAFKKQGKHVPEDISIVGFDDVWDAAYATPALTTVRQDMQEKGSKAVDAMLQLIEGKGAKLQTFNLLLPVKFIERQSVKTLNNA